MAPGLKPFQLLEINIISAQDLEPVFKKMKTYARAWVNPNRKLSSCVDTEGNNNPTWNDKFVFRVDEDFLREDTSAVMIEIHASHWFRDVIVGTVRVLVGNLIPPPMWSRRHNQHIGMRFVALQVRRPSGRPQGILNIGVALLDGSMRSMPLYTQVATSAVGYRDLMQDPQNLQQLRNNETKKNDNNNNNNNQAPIVKPILRRSRSERSERVTLDNYSPNSSMVAVPIGKNGVKESSILSISESVDPFKGLKKKGKASSVISGAELREPKQKGKKGKASSVVSDSVYSKMSSGLHKMSKNRENKKKDDDEKQGSDGLNEIPTNKVVDEKSVTKYTPKEKPPMSSIGKPVIPKYNVYDYGAPKGIGGPIKGNSIWSESSGASPSEVAAVMAERRYPLDDNQSSVLDGWSLDESVEGLRSKLERWRMELPPVYDHGGFSSSSYKSSVQHGRKRSESGSGLFSCFGNICGYECQCVCGKPPGRRSSGSRFLSSSVGTPAGRSFI
ncbi:hypothetical protein DH2020_019777 [Rehmannia glutinosa]|uniref:C2 domain-containing protein n=1 Tax=Rehmannia glutinosa TaxID=99300 RepID=A0ABR0WGE4_REHGL